MPFGEHQTCLLISFFKQWLFFWLLFCKAQLCGVIFVSLLPLINALLAWSVFFGGRHSQGRFVVVPYSFHFLIMDLMVLRGMFKVSNIFL